jgi:c-di-GMP-related signal transduction protein
MGEEPGSAARSMDFFVARQPTLTTELQLWAYELLFRSGRTDVFPEFDADGATAQVLNSTLCIFGPGSLTGGLPALLNCTPRVLLDELYTLLPRDSVVLELLETARLDDALLAACKRLVGMGYRFALDDFVDRAEIRPFLELAEFVKVDFRECDPRERARIAAELAGSHTLIAEKVETQAEADEAERLGYRYLQGFFYCRPELITRRESFGQGAACLQLMQELWKDDLDRQRIADVIRRDPGLAVKVLRLANSAAFGPRVPAESIGHALSIIGDNALRQWGTVLSLCGFAADRPSVLLRTCLGRARLCESLAGACTPAADGARAFLAAILSLVDALTGRPLSELCRELNVAPQIELAIRNREGQLGRILDLAISADRADDERAERAAAELQIGSAALVRSYSESAQWVSQVFASIGAERG